MVEVEASGRYIARTLHLLSGSTPEHANVVRILVYGQSISQQEWWLAVRQGLQARYPQARLVMENRAIGGFHSTRLLKTVEADVIPFYPDLILFQDYGPEDDYEAIIRLIRQRTTAEIAVQTDHYVSAQENAWHDRHCQVWLPELCARYQVHLLDVRERWKQHLAENQLNPEALLSDQIHLNQAGNRLMAQIVLDHLVPQPEAGPDPQGLVIRKAAGKDFPAPTPILELPFTGSRVDLVLTGKAALDIRVDGQRPSSFPDVYLAQTPRVVGVEGRPPRVGYPVRVKVNAPYQPEAWTLSVEQVIDDGREVRFALYSASGGFEGRGTSAEDFTAASGRIALHVADWFTREAPEFFDALPAVQPGQSIYWEVVCMSRDTVETQDAIGGVITAIQGVPNGLHRLRLESRDGAALPLAAVVIYCPPIIVTED